MQPEDVHVEPCAWCIKLEHPQLESDICSGIATRKVHLCWVEQDQHVACDASEPQQPEPESEFFDADPDVEPALMPVQESTDETSTEVTTPEAEHPIDSTLLAASLTALPESECDFDLSIDQPQVVKPTCVVQGLEFFSDTDSACIINAEENYAQVDEPTCDDGSLVEPAAPSEPVTAKKNKLKAKFSALKKKVQNKLAKPKQTKEDDEAPHVSGQEDATRMSKLSALKQKIQRKLAIVSPNWKAVQRVAKMQPPALNIQDAPSVTKSKFAFAWKLKSKKEPPMQQPILLIQVTEPKMVIEKPEEIYRTKEFFENLFA